VESKHWVLRGVNVHLVVCEVAQVDARIALAEGTSPGKGVWRSESFSHMVNRLHPLAAVTGPYFDTATNRPVYSLVSDGKYLVHGLSFSYIMVGNGRATIGYADNGRVDWPHHLLTGMAGGPILVQHGRLHRNQRDEGFHDPGIFRSARRTAVGTTRAGKLVLLATNESIGLRTWSRVMLDAGLTEALNLDGGMSAGLYGCGKYRVRPGRRLTSFLVVVPR